MQEKMEAYSLLGEEVSLIKNYVMMNMFGLVCEDLNAEMFNRYVRHSFRYFSVSDPIASVSARIQILQLEKKIDPDPGYWIQSTISQEIEKVSSNQ